jgi:hypothetical protein
LGSTIIVVAALSGTSAGIYVQKEAFIVKWFWQLLALVLLPASLLSAPISPTITGTQPANLKGYWKCDEPTGTTLADSSGNGKDLTITGTINTNYWLGEAGLSGASFRTDGVAGFASRTDSVIPSLDGVNFTFFAFFKGATDFTSGNALGISNSGNGNNRVGIGILNGLPLPGGGAETGAIARGNTGVMSTAMHGGKAFDGTWHSLAFRRNGTNFQLFVDGVIVASSSATLATGSTCNRTTLMHSITNVATNFAKGSVQHAAIWNTNLTDAEILAIHQSATWIEGSENVKVSTKSHTLFAPAWMTTGIDTMYFVSAGGILSPVAMGPNMTFVGGILNTVAFGVGDVTSNTSTSVDGEIALFNGTTGKSIKRGTGSGIATITGGVLGLTANNSASWDTAFSERRQWDGGATNLVPATGRTNLGGTTIGQNFFMLTNPGAIRFFRSDASNNVIAEDQATFRASLGAGTVSSFVSTDLTPATTLTITGRGTVQSATSSTTFICSPSSTISAGSLATLHLAVPNAGGAGDTKIFTQATVTDSVGNTWTRQLDTLYDPGAVNTGVELAVYTSTLATQLTSSNNVTFTLSTAATDKLGIFYEVGGTHPTFVAAGSTSDGLTSGQNGTAISTVSNSLPTGDGVIAFCGILTNSALAATDTDTTNGTWSAGQTTNTVARRMASQFKIVTGPGQQSYDVVAAIGTAWQAAWIQVSDGLLTTSVANPTSSPSQGFMWSDFPPHAYLGNNTAITGKAAPHVIALSEVSGVPNNFGTVAVSGQSNVVADNTSATLNLAAGSNITLTTTPGTRTVTIAGTGGAGSFTPPTGTGVMTVTGGVMDTASTGMTGSGNFVRASFPIVTGGTFVQASNTGSSAAIIGKRFTDTSPAGHLLLIQNAAANTALIDFDATGTMTAGTIPEGRLAYTDPNANSIRMWNDTSNTVVNATLGPGLTFNTSTNVIDATGYSDPNINAIRMWDDTDNAVVSAVIGANLAYNHSTHTLSATIPSTVRSVSLGLQDLGGSALVAPQATKGTRTVPYSGTITGYSISVDAGTCTVKWLKKADGTVIPTTSDSINTSGVSLSTGTHVRSATVSDFTSTTVNAGDMFSLYVTASSGATWISTELEITSP